MTITNENAREIIRAERRKGMDADTELIQRAKFVLDHGVTVTHTTTVYRDNLSDCVVSEKVRYFTHDFETLEDWQAARSGGFDTHSETVILNR